MLSIDSKPDESYAEIRSAVGALCEGFPDTYWRKLDRERGYPSDFVQVPSMNCVRSTRGSSSVRCQATGRAAPMPRTRLTTS